MSIRKTLVLNFFKLGAGQFISYLIPIILIPLLFSRVGVTLYGKIALAQGIAVVLGTLIDFGTNLSGTSSIAGNISDDKTYSKIYMTRVIMSILGCSALYLLIHLIPQWLLLGKLIMTSSLIAIGQNLIPTWYYQGTQRMGFLTIYQVVSRSIYLGLVFSFVRSEEDYLLVNLFNALSWTLVGAFSIWHTISIFGQKIITISPVDLFNYMKGNTSIFCSNIVSSLYRNGGIILAGFVLLPEQLGNYSVFDKLINLLNNSFPILFRSLFPTVTKIASSKDSSLSHFFRKIIINVFPFVLVGVFILIAFGSTLMSWVFINKVQIDNLQSGLILVSLLAVGLSVNLPISLTLLARGLNGRYLWYNMIALISFIPLGLFLGSKYAIIGLLCSYVVAELLMFLFGIFLVKNKSSAHSTEMI